MFSILQLHECVGSAVGSMGPETFLCLLPLKLEASDLSEVNVWLFPILKQYIIGARLNFFMEKLLGMAKLIGQKSRKVCIFSLSLLPSFVWQWLIGLLTTFGSLS